MPTTTTTTTTTATISAQLQRLQRKQVIDELAVTEAVSEAVGRIEASQHPLIIVDQGFCACVGFLRCSCSLNIGGGCRSVVEFLAVGKAAQHAHILPR